MEVEEFIKRFNGFGLQVKDCFTNRNCYYFYIILKSRYPQAIPYYDKEKSHIVTKIGNNFYDINGRLSQKQLKEYNFVPFCELNSGLQKQLL